MGQGVSLLCDFVLGHLPTFLSFRAPSSTLPHRHRSYRKLRGYVIISAIVGKRVCYCTSSPLNLLISLNFLISPTPSNFPSSKNFPSLLHSLLHSSQATRLTSHKIVLHPPSWLTVEGFFLSEFYFLVEYKLPFIFIISPKLYQSLAVTFPPEGRGLRPLTREYLGFSNVINFLFKVT